MKMRSMIAILVLAAIAHESASRKISLYNSDTPANLPLVKSCLDACFHDYQISFLTTMPFRSLSKRICDTACSVKFCEHSKMISNSPRYGVLEKCSILCDMEKALQNHQVPCTSNPGTPMTKKPTQNFVPLETYSLTLNGCNKDEKRKEKEKEKEKEKSKPNKKPPPKRPQNPPQVHVICSQLCKQGNGGKLCKCDLTPF